MTNESKLKTKNSASKDFTPKKLVVIFAFAAVSMSINSFTASAKADSVSARPSAIQKDHRGGDILPNKPAALSTNDKVPAAKKFTSTSAAISEYGTQVRAKLKPLFRSSGVEYPPKEQYWICLKQEKLFYVFAKNKDGKMQQLLSYPIIGASGGAGPKLKEGDKQVPEGFYKFDGFRPNVIAHLGLSVNYPNEEDRKHAKAEGRTNLGCDILVHGSRWSTGCLAMGNEPIEELFVLAHDSGLETISLIFAPCNLLTTDCGLDLKKQPDWLAPLYKRLKTALSEFFPTK